jgi:PAS domain S-box-containing protein
MNESLSSFLREIFSSSDRGVILVDSKSLNIVLANDIIEALMGYPKGELLDKPVGVILEHDNYFSQHNVTYLEQTTVIKEDWNFRHQNGSLVNLGVTMKHIPKPDKPAEFIYVISLSEEPNTLITNIRDSEERLRTIFATMNNGIVIVDEKGIIQEIAPIFKFLLFQYLPLEKGDFIFSFLDNHLQQTFLEKIHEVISSSEQRTKEFDYNILDREFTFEVRFIPIRRHRNFEKVIMLVFTDRSEAKKLDRQLIESMKFASIGEIAAGLAHEINNPLQSALLYLDDLILVDDDDPAERKSILKKIESANLRIRDLVRSLLDLGRVESQTRDLVSPYYILVRASELVEVSCKKKGIDFKRHAGPNLPGIVVRWQEIEQVLINCVVNSINALSEMHPSKQFPKIEIGIDLIQKNKKDWVVFSIEDNGPGMTEQVLEKAFIPLFTTRRDKQGTGLGLSISKKIINDHDGEISIKSKLDEGTKIEILIPAQLDIND